MIIRTGIIVLLPALIVIGCSTNPVTGKKELSLIPESWELNQGKQLYAPMRQSQGGDYEVDAKVQAYVSEIGQRLAAVSDRKLPYEFKVLNNSAPNAWALPGGKIAINRGLLTELNSEAELAAVLGHEIVHAAAKHGAQGMQRGMLLQGLVLASAIATEGKQYANVAELGSSLGAQLVNQKYGRDAERESDQYGMKYMSRAGYDPQGAVELQKTFVKLSKEKRQDWLSGLFASHPPSKERVQNNIRIASSLPKGGTMGRDRYKKMMARLIKSKPAYDKYDKAQKAVSKNQLTQAKSLIRQAIKIEPREGHFQSLLGDIEENNKRYKTAVNQYSKAINLNDNFFYYYLKRGMVNKKLNNSRSAKKDFEKSVKLLPTANAYNALGDIASNEKQYKQAKAYYAKAASNSGDVGKSAFASLAKLDLADNPGKYIKLRTGLDRNNRLAIEIHNTTPIAVSGLVIQVRYPDSTGVVRQVRKALHGDLKPGEKDVVSMNISVKRVYANKVGASVERAVAIK